MAETLGKTNKSAAPVLTAPTIHSLKIERFRGIKSLIWLPAKGVNVVLGGGDVGKTTILDAIALLLSPTNSANLSDTDYYARDQEAGFLIEAVVALPPGSGISNLTKPSWPWDWNGVEASVPGAGPGSATNTPVYLLRAQGTPDLELLYEIVQPDGTADSLPIVLRRAIGLVRLSGDDRNDRDLRLVQGSALDRLISDKGLRSRLVNDLSKNDVKGELLDQAQETLKALDVAFRAKSLPEKLDLAITGSQGLSIASLIGLTADREGVQLPLASWGAGTRRIAALTISEQKQGDAPITIVDEVERGLEPYRQRELMEKLQSGKSQVFVTTHSPPAIAASSTATLWYVDHNGQIGELESKQVTRHRQIDPETFLSRLAVVAEGVTEYGFVSSLLERALGAPPQKYGIHVTDGGGHESTLNLLETLTAGGLVFGAFADDEGLHPKRWQNISTKVGKLLFRWQSKCIEENMIDAVSDDKLEALLTDPKNNKTGMRLRTLKDRQGTAEKDFETIKAATGAGLKALIVSAALGTVPDDKVVEKKEYQSHSQTWFKSASGGRELADKMFSLGIWPTFKPQLMPFCNAVRKAVHLDEIEDLQP
jgi:putative ATP-dependent endonuclease of OLD family